MQSVVETAQSQSDDAPSFPEPVGTAARRRRKPSGRPANVSADDTRRRILDTARECFAAYGYTATTNRTIADRLGLTTASVYHHFGRKSDLMRAVFEATEAESSARMRNAVAGKRGVLAKIDALLDATHATMVEDRSKAVFMFVVRDEIRRHEELSRILFDRTFAELLSEIVDQAIEDREVSAQDAKLVRGALAAIALGLAGLGTDMSTEAHRTATEGCKRLIAATVLKPTIGP
jgi:AcrR family transcriptional regulator